MHAYTKCNRSRGCVISFITSPACREGRASGFPRTLAAALMLASVSGSRTSCAGGRSAHYTMRAPGPRSRGTGLGRWPTSDVELRCGIAEVPPDHFSPLDAVTGDFIGGVRHD